jgi:hypothetical protein
VSENPPAFMHFQVSNTLFLFDRQKSRATQQGLPTPTPAVQAKGPDEDKIKLILERTGYSLDVTTGSYFNILFVFFTLIISQLAKTASSFAV